MKLRLLLIFLLLCSIYFFPKISLAQGGWNIDYFPIQHLDSMYNFFKGKEIKLDFRRNLEDTVKIIANSRNSIMPISYNDTVSIRIFDSTNIFVEKWELYVDQGYFKKQYLKGINETHFVEIRRITLTGLDKNNIYLNMEVIGTGFRSNTDVIIEKKLVKGILYKNNGYPDSTFYSSDPPTISYLPIQLIDSLDFLKNEEVRIDFRKNIGDTLKPMDLYSINKMSLLSNDTIAIAVFDSVDIFTEQWNFNNINDQYLKGINETSFMEIRHIILTAVDENYLYLNIEVMGAGHQPSKDIIIDKKFVKGILYKIE
ncbi:hypothetical protein ACE193_20025 [Bernardetia sp. OM2101]|uniref:hypothetical protein n=1 Tax=Bernardetia sp. OM2101 TaxID=3344876 RepID=UPI0035CECDE5